MADDEAATPEPPASSSTQRRNRLLVQIVAVVVVLGVGAALVVTLLVADDADGEAGGDAPTTTEEQVEGGVLRIAVAGFDSFDPALASDPAAVMVADHLFDTLVRYDPDTLEPTPGLAESWEAGPEQRRFTFHLRDDAMFHDGSPVTATDVKATLQRIAAPESSSDYRFLLERVVGFEEFHDAGTADTLAGVRVDDERTVTIELREPFSFLPAVLGNPGFGIVPAGAADPGGDPIGSGPLRLVEQADGVAHLETHPDYRPASPAIDGVELHLVDERAEAFERLERGQVDVAPVPADRVNAAADEYGDEGMTPFLGVLFYGMNLDAPEFEDPRMRRAVVAAVDRRRVVDVVYDSTVLLADGLVPAGAPEAVDDACGERCDHDPEEARRLVAEVFADETVPTVSVDFDQDPVQQAVASAIASDLEAAGIPTELRPHDFQDYGVFLVNETPELFRLGWTLDYPSSDGFLFPVFVSGERDNLTNLADEEVDDLLRRARAEGDVEERTRLLREAEQRVLDRFPVLPIAQFTNRWAVAARVEGFEMSAMGTFDVTAVALERAGDGSG